MKIGGTLAFWTKVAIGLAAVYLLWKVYRGAVTVVGGVIAAGEKVGEIVAGVGETVGAAAERPASVEEYEGASAPGYGP